MPDSVAQAAVSVLGIILAGGIAYLASVATAKRTIIATRDDVRAALDAERGHRLWERRADVYAHFVGYAQHRSVMRSLHLEKLRSDDLTDAGMKILADLYEAPGSWFQMSGQLIAYASDEVYAAYRAAAGADNVAARALIDHRIAVERAAELTVRRSSTAERQAADDGVAAATTAVAEANVTATTLDGILVDVIRAELRAPAIRHDSIASHTTGLRGITFALPRPRRGNSSLQER